MQTIKELINILTIIFGSIAFGIFITISIYLILPISTGTGTYTGFLIATHDKGLIFKTKGAGLKSPLSDSESFCILDPAIYAQLNAISHEKPIQVTYEEKAYTGSWQCDFWDSNKIITSIREET